MMREQDLLWLVLSAIGLSMARIITHRTHPTSTYSTEMHVMGPQGTQIKLNSHLHA